MQIVHLFKHDIKYVKRATFLFLRLLFFLYKLNYFTVTVHLKTSPFTQCLLVLLTIQLIVTFPFFLAVTLCPPSESPFVATVAILELLLFQFFVDGCTPP